MIQNGEDGLLVAPGSVDELVAAFESLTTEKLAALAAGARASRSRLTWDGYAEALEGLLRRVIPSEKVSSNQSCPPDQ